VKSFVMSVCLSVHPSACNNSTSTWWIFKKPDIWLVFKNLFKKFKFHHNLTITVDISHADRYTHTHTHTHTYIFDNFLLSSSWNKI
jgi:hypothetical protein